MLRHTRDRIRSLVPTQRIITIVNRTHLGYAQKELINQPPATILIQPCGRGTANGMLLPLLHIASQDPQALVGVFPSDHFVLDERTLMRYVERAFDVVKGQASSIALLAVSPSEAEPEYGWIEKGDAVYNLQGLPVHRVRRFWEKPDRPAAEELYRSGCLWNTSILVGRVGAFLSLFQEIIPEAFAVLHDIVRLPNPVEKGKLLSLIYPDLPSLDFSAGILERCADRLCVVEMSQTGWSDWGNESRVLRDVARLRLTLHGQDRHAFA
jgi:mannose-1-phosphate guanylyltransferase